MDGAKIFFSHMVKARIILFAKTRARIFFSKKTQAPPWDSNGRSLRPNVSYVSVGELRYLFLDQMSVFSAIKV